MKDPEVRIYIDGLIVDSFAGGGGASLGIELATGRSPDVAINHDAEAIAMHALNHPTTRHYCEDVWKVSPREATGGRKVGLMWLSPDCKHFSKAKGGRPVEKKIRGLAWVAYRWAKEADVDAIVLENVEEFVTWGPLDKKTGKPDAVKKGFTFRRFVAMLSNLGYTVDWKELVAADYGAPTTRKRLFLIARKDGRPIIWPEPTHAPKGRHGLLPWRSAAECIDFSLRCPSIFLTPAEARTVGVKRPLAENTMKRIARGLRKFVIDNPNPFIVRCAHGEASKDGTPRWGKGEHSVDEALPTLTGSRDFAVVAPTVAKFRGDSAGASIESPLPTITAGPKENPAGAAHALGVVQATVAPFITEHANASNQRNMPADDPLRTQCAQVKGGHFAIVQPYLAGVGGRKGQSPETDTERPMHTVTAKADTVLIAPYAVPRYGEREGQEPRALSIEGPTPTIVPDRNGAQLVAAFMAKHNGGHEATGQVIDRPLDTIMGTDQKALVAVNLAVHTSGHSGAAADAPAPAITTGGQHAVTASHIVKLKGTARDGQSVADPLHTVQASGNHYAEVQAFLTRYNGTSVGQSPALPLSTVDATDRLGLVTVQGADWVIVDIGMRMLQPRELYLAQGFPSTYKIDMLFKGKPLPKDAQVRMVGNSVCPPVAAAIVRANFTAMEQERVA